MTSAAETHLDLEDLPPLVKSNLCEIIEQKNSYEELGRLMQFNEFDIAVIKKYNLGTYNLIIIILTFLLEFQS